MIFYWPACKVPGQSALSPYTLRCWCHKNNSLLLLSDKP